jgi:hypothetical protein
MKVTVTFEGHRTLQNRFFRGTGFLASTRIKSPTPGGWFT